MSADIKRPAYRIQERAYGGLPSEVHGKMQRILQGAGLDKIDSKGPAKTPVGTVAGALLIREWKGRRQEVVVMENGFDYGGQWFRSLSAIAAYITGTKWNGPAFFGLRENGGGR